MLVLCSFIPLHLEDLFRPSYGQVKAKWPVYKICYHESFSHFSTGNVSLKAEESWLSQPLSEAGFWLAKKQENEAGPCRVPVTASFLPCYLARLEIWEPQCIHFSKSLGVKEQRVQVVSKPLADARKEVRPLMDSMISIQFGKVFLFFLKIKLLISPILKNTKAMDVGQW